MIVRILVLLLLACGPLSIGPFTAVSAAYADMVDTGRLHSKRGICCNEFDGRPPEAVWELSDGSASNVHYRVMIEGQWVDVPDEAVLEVPNYSGVAIVWYSATRTLDKSTFFIRCFIAGPLF